MEDFVPAAEVAGLYSCGRPCTRTRTWATCARTCSRTRCAARCAGRRSTVRHVVNITDVGHAVADTDTGEDKLEVAAARERRSVLDIAAFYTDAFFVDTAALNILPADEYPRASAYVEQMIEFAKPSWKRRLHLPAAVRPVLRHLQGPRLRRAGPDVRRRTAGGGPGRARGGTPPQDRLRAVAGGGARQAPGAALGFAVGLGRAGLAPGVLGDEHGPARRAFRPAHRRGGPPRAAPRERDRAEPGVPRRRPAVGAVLAAQRVPAAGRREDGQVGGRRAPAGRPDRSRLPPDGLPPVPARRPLPQPARFHHRGRRRRPGHAAPAGRQGPAAAPAARSRPSPTPPRPPRATPSRSACWTPSTRRSRPT